VVGNGFHTASSTRTSLGVLTLQGLPLAHLAPDFAGRSLHTLGCTAKALAGVSRYPSVGESFVFQCAFAFCFTFSRFPIRFAHRSPLLAKQPLPPELCALMQLPVPQWLSRLFTGFQHGYGPRCRSLCRHGAERVTASLSTAASSSSPTLRSASSDSAAFFLPSYAFPFLAFRSESVLRASGRFNCSLSSFPLRAFFLEFLARRSVLLSGRW